MYRKTYEVTGYTSPDGAAYCLDHVPYNHDSAEADWHPIFLGTEFQGAPSCDVCFEPIECNDIGAS